jgi:hypothetical protein
MKRRAFAAVWLGIALLAMPAFAQSPKNWLVRADRSTSATDPDGAGNIKFSSTAAGFHATTPQAAVFWNPENTASGSYSLKGTFTLMKPSGHTNYYGLVFGGKDLGGSQQRYLYFLVAQDGSWLLKKRDGDRSTEDVAPRAVNAAVRKPDAQGKSVNALEVRVGASTVEYFVNGTRVTTTPKAGAAASTDGIYGIRVNHLLDVQVDGFGVSKP